MGTITTRALGGMAFESAIGVHRLIIDVPEAMGGQGRGPTPPELFVASLGSCVAAFVPVIAGSMELMQAGLRCGLILTKMQARRSGLLICMCMSVCQT